MEYIFGLIPLKMLWLLIIVVVFITVYLVLNKKKIQRKIEENTVKSTLTWKDKNGEHEEVVLLKRSKLPLVGDWARIYPILNEDGSWNYVNLLFGGKKNLIKLILILGVLLVLFLGINDILSGCRTIVETPCVQDCIKTINLG